MEGLEGFFTRYYNSEEDAVHSAVELYIRHGQTNNLTVDDTDTVFAIRRTRYKYLVVEIISTEKNREKNHCVAVMTYERTERTERKIIEKLQLPDGTTKTVVLKPQVFKLVHCRFITK